MAEIRHTIDSLSRRQDSIAVGNMAEFRTSALLTYRMQPSDSAAFRRLAQDYISADSTYAVSSRAKQLDIKSNMRSKVQTQASDLSIKSSNMYYGDRNIRRHWIEWMKKITNSLSILIFFFIGAPLGAIIRKGGLGVPVIISVFTFILFYITSVSGEKMFREGEWSIVGCWFSCIVLTPLSVFFTVKANRDSTLFQWDVITEFFRHWFGTKVSRHIVRKDVVIDDPDVDHCLTMLADIKEHCIAPETNVLTDRLPDYVALFFKGVEAVELNALSAKLEELVTELGNSRDRVVLDQLNGLPIIPAYGVETPFEKRWLNRTVGIVFPLGLLFWLRAWLFSRKLKRQLAKTVQVSDNLINYLTNNKKPE